jgi:hypothetical protein
MRIKGSKSMTFARTEKLQRRPKGKPESQIRIITQKAEE